MTPEQWKAVEESLRHPGGSVELLCDGRKVSARVTPSKPLRYVVTVYVDGQWRGEWFRADPPRDEHRFMNARTKAMYSAAEIKPLRRLVSAKELRDMEAKKYRWFEPSFPTAKAFILRIKAGAKDIKLVDCTAAQLAALQFKQRQVLEGKS